MHSILLIFCLSFFSFMMPALADTEHPFMPDSNVQKVAEAYALDAVDFAKEQFNISLDWSDASIAKVEQSLAMMHLSFLTTNPRPTEEQTMAVAKAFGSYVGEVYRKNHGGSWGIFSLNGQQYPGLQATSGVNFWPWGRAHNRIFQGPENNIADYYRALLEK
ncbi:hypothetical protein ACFOKJ_03985 [Vogesella amnigena]|uniref:Uncharacterized protein n=1 Tax=Vogesella amnigena TaxID=1507449 RepID=A0ABV7TRE3_9NEIS